MRRRWRPEPSQIDMGSPGVPGVGLVILLTIFEVKTQRFLDFGSLGSCCGWLKGPHYHSVFLFGGFFISLMVHLKGHL